MRTRVQSGRVKGCQPTLIHFNNILDLAQRGMDDPSVSAELRYQKGNEVTISDKGMSKARPEDMSKLIDESGEKANLINLRFLARQDNPARSVNIRIAPDGWVYYTVQSSDFTWALGRFHELTEALLATRRLPAMARFPLPEMLVSDRYIRWGTPLWVSEPNRRVRLLNVFRESPIWLPPFVALALLYSPPRLSFAGIVFLAGITCAYVAAAFSYFRWLFSTYKAQVLIASRKPGFISLMIGKQADPGYRAMFAITALGSIIALLAYVFGNP